MWATGAGSDVIKRIAAPMVGGIFTSFLLELLVYPAIYEVWRWNTVAKNSQTRTSDATENSEAGLNVRSPSPIHHVTGD
jgi:Cu(I)/Ag(I) efflux system membrane protein CusA/SilA